MSKYVGILEDGSKVYLTNDQDGFFYDGCGRFWHASGLAFLANKKGNLISTTREEDYEDADRPIDDSALGQQIGGNHYQQFEIQPVEFINANSLDFLQGSVIKYITRHKLKGGKADVEKAAHFCKLIMELQYEEGGNG